MRKWIAIFILLIISVLIYKYVYQEHRNISNEVSEYKTASKDIINEFKDNSTNAENKYLNKTIEISGTVTQHSNKTITINETIFCQFTEEIIVTENNFKITIKGRFIGYDDLLEEIKLDQCTIIN